MSRVEWILGILLVVLLLIVVVLSLVFWFGPNRTAVNQPSDNEATAFAQQLAQPAPTSMFEGNTAKVAYAQAQNQAKAWQPDAQLLNVSATWPHGANEQELREGATTWAFTFYSPTGNQIAVFSVIDEAVNLVSEGEYSQQAPLLDVTGWNIDSHEVVEKILTEGGAQFLNDSGVTSLTMMLNMEDLDGNGRIVWEAILLGLQSGQALSVHLDATSGDILETQIVP